MDTRGDIDTNHSVRYRKFLSSVLVTRDKSKSAAASLVGLTPFQTSNACYFSRHPVSTPDT
eukprot:765928-Hanusia_phi.AAC.4